MDEQGDRPGDEAEGTPTYGQILQIMVALGGPFFVLLISLAPVAFRLSSTSAYLFGAAAYVLTLLIVPSAVLLFRGWLSLVTMSISLATFVLGFLVLANLGAWWFVVAEFVGLVLVSAYTAQRPAKRTSE